MFLSLQSFRERTYPEEQRKKGSVKGHRYNARQPREQSIQKPMLIFLQKPTRPIPKRITLLRKKKKKNIYTHRIQQE
jgi:hypothetical protein